MAIKVERAGLNLTQAARYVGLSVPTFSKVSKQISHRKVGKRLIFSKVVLDDWIRGEEA